MAEINNSLALGIRSDAPDIGKTLLNAAQIRALQTKSELEQAQTGQTQQETGYRQFQQDSNGGYRASEVNTLAEANQKRAGLAGQIGNIMVNDPSPNGVRQAIDMAKRSGVPIDPSTEQHLLSSRPQQIIQYGKNMQAAGQSSSQNIEQNPGQIGARAGAAVAATAPYEPVQIPPGSKVTTKEQLAHVSRPTVKPSTAIMGDDEAVKNGLYSPTPDQRARGITGPSDVPGISGIGPKAQAEQTVVGDTLGKEYAGIKQDAIGAATTKYLLKNLQDDAARFATGKGATAAGTAKQWIQAAGQLPGVGPAIQKITGDISDPVAAFEAVQKNAGQLTRATLKDVEGRAALEYKMIQQQLPNAEMSPKGLQQVTAQMMAPEDYKQARLQAADKWRRDNGGSIDGFSTDWNKNVGPGAFLFARLPSEEQKATVQRLNKTPEGKRTLQSIRTQMQWAHDHGLDSVID